MRRCTDRNTVRVELIDVVPHTRTAQGKVELRPAVVSLAWHSRWRPDGVGASHRQAGHGGGLAPTRLSPVLDVEEPPAHGTTERASGRARLDPGTVDGESPRGAPRIHGELQKLGIAVSQSTVAKFMRRHPRPPSQTWRTFLANHASQIMAADLFVVPGDIPAAVRAGHPWARPSANHPRGRDQPSDGGLDRATGAERLPRRPSAPLSPA